MIMKSMVVRLVVPECIRPYLECDGRRLGCDASLLQRFRELEPESARHRGARRVARVAPDLDEGDAWQCVGDGEDGLHCLGCEAAARQVRPQPVPDLYAIGLTVRNPSLGIPRVEPDLADDFVLCRGEETIAPLAR